jgi:MFS family permease
MHVPVIWIGVLLSVNRFVRLVANQLFAYLFNNFGFKRISILAAVFAMLSTGMYGMTTGIAGWVIARITWGFCYSALRISAISYSLGNKRQGFSLGLNKGLQELGPIISLLTGPLLLKLTNPSATFLIFSVASLSAVIIAFRLPELKHLAFTHCWSFNLMPSSFNLLTFLSSFFVQGVLIVTITQLLNHEAFSLNGLTALAGFYLAYRRICTVFISPFGGMLADKWGMDKVYITASFMTVAGLLLIATGFTKTGIITAFSFNSISNAVAHGNAVNGVVNHLKAVAANSTWSDIGAATGALMAGSFLVAVHLTSIYVIGSIGLLLACIFHIKTTRIQIKEIL